MSRGTKIVWLAFLGMCLYASVMSNFVYSDDPDSDGGGRCAVVGFGVLMLLVIGTVLEMLSQRRSPPKGFDVLPPKKRPSEPPEGG